MTGFNQVSIGGYPDGGLTQDRKPLLLSDRAYSELENAYVFRERTKKRDGDTPMGRLRRVLVNQSLGTSGASPWTFNIYTLLSLTPEPNAEIESGSVFISIGSKTFADQGNGILSRDGVITGATNATLCVITSAAHGLSSGNFVIISQVMGMTQLNGNTYRIISTTTNTFTLQINSTGYGVYTGGGIWIVTGNSGTINYMTGAVTLIYTGSTASSTISFNYFPALPVMGILRREVSTIGVDFTIFFDTVYAYQYVDGFQELVAGETWTGTTTDFFWAANYQGASADLRYFFVTNNNIDIPNTLYDPIRYYNNSTWTDLKPLITATQTLFQALILIPYYGRLLALNTWEGLTDTTYIGAVNFFARCRFSQIGDPTDQTMGWRSDIFGKGGFIDAPTNESIVSVAFFRNTLIVFFEYSTWQLRYIGEYGIPFIFERVSSDFGSVSPYSSVVFDQGVMTVSDRGIIQSAANGVSRLDDQIPEQVFSFDIQNNASNFVHGIRDFEKELVYWNYLDTSNSSATQSYPNTTLVFNYKNNTWAKFRDTITCFGPAQFQFSITWDSLTTYWESSASWDNVDDQQYVDYIASGTQQGFINIYQNPDVETPQPTNSLYANSMAITAVDFTVNPTKITIPSHNLLNSEIIYITGMVWIGNDPGINNMIYNVTIVDANRITLSTWNQTSGSYEAFNSSSTSVYNGGGKVTLFPKMNIVGKDFNPYQNNGKQFKLAFIDFQMDSNILYPSISAITIQLFINSYLGEQANLISSNRELINSSQTCGFISNITKSNPCQVTSVDHSLITGTVIYIANVLGMTQINSANYQIIVLDANNFTLVNVDSTGFDAYIKNGIWNSAPARSQTYIPGSQYAWYRFYSTQYGQYLRIALTYDDSLMNQLATHQTPMELNAMNIWFRDGGRLIN